MSTAPVCQKTCFRVGYKSAYVSEHDRNDELCVAAWFIYIATHPLGTSGTIEILRATSCSRNPLVTLDARWSRGPLISAKAIARPAMVSMLYLRYLKLLSSARGTERKKHTCQQCLGCKRGSGWNKGKVNKSALSKTPLATLTYVGSRVPCGSICLMKIHAATTCFECVLHPSVYIQLSPAS